MTWQKVGLVVDGRHAEALADALAAEGAVSAEWTDADAGSAGESPIYAEPGAVECAWPRARVTALFATDRDAARAVEAALASAGARSLTGASLEPLEDADWVAQTQRQFGPIAAGRRLWIVPTWHAAPDPDAVNIVLDPGAAFGTGSHPTTRMVLEWLERHVRAGDSVLDYGCGSGILAIAALKLGARSATGVDIDPLALEAARYNAARNAVALTLATTRDRLSPGFRLTVANILANPLCMLAPLLVHHTAAHGRIALSGILEAQAPGVIEAYRPWCDLGIEALAEGWALVAGTRRGGC